MPVSPSTPLSAMDAVVLDTETTGLNPRTARIVQIGAVRLIAGRVADDETLDTLVNPGIPIPAESSAVHGTSDAMVATAPNFGDVAPVLAEWLDDTIVIGHSIAYDVEILSREYRLANRPFRTPHVLDVRVLARIAAPELGQYDLDRLCSWLGVKVRGRHTASGDALTTADAFLALVPLLRTRNVRTLAEAISTSARILEAEAVTVGSLPATADAPPDLLLRTAYVDSFPYRHRVRDVMSAPPLYSDSALTVVEAARVLLEHKASSTFVRLDSGDIGIVTERDMLRAISANAKGLNETLGSLANHPLLTIGADDFVYRAIGRIERLGIRHLGVVDADGTIVGAVTTRNLLRHRSTTALVLGDDIEMASDTAGLAAAWSKLTPMAASLAAEEVDARQISGVISSELQHLTRRAAELAEARMVAEGKGAPPTAYAVLVLGSGGRGESLLASDQDNAIVYDHGEDGSAIDQWFETFATHMCATLDTAGVPFCKGGVMATNRAWRMSSADWRKRIDGWLARQHPDDLLYVDIFFDAEAVHGDLEMGRSLRTQALAKAKGARDFVVALTEIARRKTPALTMFGRLRLDDGGRIDLKKCGLMPIFSCARVLAIKHGIDARSTPGRLRGLAAHSIGSPDDIETIIEAHRAMMDLILAQQLRDIAAGIPPSSRVDSGALERKIRAALLRALGAVDIVIDLVSEGRF